MACSEQRLIKQGESKALFDLFSQLKIQKRIITGNQLVLSDCSISELHTTKGTQLASLYIAPKSCIANGLDYTQDEANKIQNYMATHFKAIEDKSNYCNTFHRYSPDTTEFTYNSGSGFTTPEHSYYYEVKYKQGMASLRFREPGVASVSYCAENVPVNNSEAFFPVDGLNYEVYKTLYAIADAPTSSIKYSDVNYGLNGQVTFFLNKISAETYKGGAILAPAHQQSISAAVTDLVAAAKTLNLANPCP